MSRVPLHSKVALIGVALMLSASPARAQSTAIPTISERQYTSGSAKIIVTGAFQMNEEVPINTQASTTSGGQTWLQYGASGTGAPEALITYQPAEIGVFAGKGKAQVTAGIIQGEPPQCTGATEVTPTSVSGQYKCLGATSFDRGTFKMGKVDVEVRFTAK